VAAVAYTIVDRRVASVVYHPEPSQKKNKKHWDWDSAYHRQGSYLCRDTAPEPDLHQKLTIFFISPLPTFPQNFMQIHSEVFAQSW